MSPNARTDTAAGPALSHRFAAALITGGQSRRMGRDKAWLDWNGEPLWQYQLRKLAGLGPTLLLIACREEQRLSAAGAETLHDPPGNEGPLPALARCLERAQMPIIVLAVDMPHVTVPFLRDLLEQCGDMEKGAVFQAEYGFEPLCAVYPVTALPLLMESLAEGNLRLQSFVHRAVEARVLRAIPLSKEQEAHFLNLNTPADLA